MLLDKIADYFMPAEMRHNKAHPRYDEFRVIASALPAGVLLLGLFPLFLLYLNKPVLGYYVNAAMLLATLLCMKYYSHYRIPMSLTAIATYFIVYGWIKDSGLIYSANTSILHMYLLGAIWADKRYGWWSVFSNLAVFGYIYYQTVHTGTGGPLHGLLGSPLYAFGMHALITVFFGGFLGYEQYDQERNRRKIRALQDEKISLLDEAVKKRTEQLNNMRQALATDFHDQTGNMLSAITRQASLLKQKLAHQSAELPLVESILQNSKDLYAASKDFLWNLNHNSDDPLELFHYLTAYGQAYYNQFDIAFSSHLEGEAVSGKGLEAFAALNLIFIFKEAMTNVVKHAGAGEVVISMRYNNEQVVYSLQDDGRWKKADEVERHYGLTNMERRCEKNGFSFSLTKDTAGTGIRISVPVTTHFI